ncbi:MAG TPA: RNA methyltransferase [Anaeromyxobacteraceae bacterium]|nr:RNA methyltransferase [Anaeromyxobacteraceae bacterium]
MERIFAACTPGLEPVLARELASFGLRASAVPGGVEAAGDDAVAVACLRSRAADAVALRVYDGPEKGLDRAFADARRRYGARAPLVPRREGGRATLSMDAAGAPLFKRGWRQRVGAAPLRESLAAGLLLAAGFDGSQPFLDPMCGSGTIAVEAALIAARRAPGLGRVFDFESWPGRDPRRLELLRAQLAAEACTPAAPLRASDRNAGALRLAQKNAAAAGVGDLLTFERLDAAAVEAPGSRGVCVVNPPYGVRLDEDAPAAWRSLAALVARMRGWTVAVLGPERGFADAMPLAPSSTTPVRNGGLRCVLLVYRP